MNSLSNRLTFTQGESGKNLINWTKKLVLVDDGDFEIKQLRASNQVISQLLPDEVRNRLEEISRGKLEQIHLTALSCYAIVLSKYLGRSQFVIAAHDFLHAEDYEDLLIKVDIRKELSFKDLLLSIRESYQEALQFKKLPIDMLEEKLESYSKAELIVGNYQAKERDQMKVDNIHIPTFSLSIQNTSILLNLNYHESLNVNPKSFIDHFIGVTSHVLFHLDNGIDGVELMDKKEKDEVLSWGIGSNVSYPVKTIHELFEEQVEKTPDHVALVYEGEELSYRELNEKSNQLARHIRMKYKEQTGEELKSDTLIGLYVDRSLEMVIGIMAVLKAGGAYVPLSPDYPEERVKYMLDDSSSKLLITEEDYVERLQGWLGGSITLLLPGDVSTEMASDNLEVYSGPEDLAYVIYTSGTTGKPKGVMIEHRSVSDLAAFICKTHKISDKTRSLFFSDYIFDASVMELFPSLLSGSPIFIAPESTRKDSLELLEFISTHAIEKAFLPTAITLALSEKLADTTLQVLHTGGDRLSRLSHLPAPLTFNQYGPTESTVLVTQNVLDDSKDVGIGKPVSNSRLYVLDSSGHPVPIGVVGELYIGGAGLARGYLNNAELTSERFIANPFATESDREKGYTRLYKTGDMVRWLADGNLEFLGRRDSQVKIRGYRIELGEVESVLGSQPGVNQCVVVDLDREQGEKYLVGYVVSAGGSLDVEDLRSGLQKELPDYMVPSVLMELAELPLTINGKLDRKGLPDPVFKGAGYVSPRNELEAQLCKIWEELLGLERVGIEDDFFRIGGDSIKVIQVASRLLSDGYETTARDVFLNPTIQELANVVNPIIKSKNEDPIEGNVVLSPIQQIFLNEDNVDKHHFNHSIALKTLKTHSIEELNTAFKIIINHHDALRSVFLKEKDNYQQFNLGEIDNYQIEVNDYRHREDPLSDLSKKAMTNQSIFRLDKFPLIRVDYYLLPEENYLVITVHHLIVDVVSWGIILSDLDYLLNPATDALLPAKTSSWLDWTEAIASYQYKKANWGICSTLLPRDNNCSSNLLKTTRNQSFQLDKKRTDLLVNQVHKRFRTNVQDFILTALFKALFKISDLDGFSVEVETYGRQFIQNLDVSRTIGWFTSFYPITFWNDEIQYPEDLILVKEQIRSIEPKSLDYMLLRRDVDLEKPLVLFNYLGEIGNNKFESFEWSDLPIGDPQSLNRKRNHEWDINSLVVEGKLVFNLSYNGEAYNEETIQNLNQQIKVELVELIDYFNKHQNPLLTPSDLIKPYWDLESLLRLQKKYKVKDVYPLTPMQEGMFFHSIADEEFGFYNTQLDLHVEGELKVNEFKEAYEFLERRHEILRSRFIQDKSGIPWQVVLEQPTTDFEIIYLDQLDETSKQTRLTELLEKDKQRKFDLGLDALSRVIIIVLGPSSYRLLWSYHHIILDGWSMSILTAEWTQCYKALVANQEFKPAYVSPYRNFVKWREQNLKESSNKYWSDLLKGYTGSCDLPLTNRRHGKINRAARINKSILFDTKTSEKLREVARHFKVTLNVLFQGVWSVILSKYSNRSDIVFGTVVSGRPSDLIGIESMVGLFINNIPIRAMLEDDKQFGELLIQLSNQTIDSQTHQYSSLAEIQSKIPEASLVNHILLFENYPLIDSLNEGIANENSSTNLKILETNAHDINNYPFTLVVVPSENIQLKINLNPEIHPEIIADHIFSYFEAIFQKLGKVDNPKIRELKALPATLSNELLKHGMSSDKLKHPETIPARLRQVVEKYGECQAVLDSEKTLTYGELDYQSNKMVNLLNSYDIQKGDVVAVHLENSVDTFIAIWGILKIGAVYLPLDRSWPEKRKQYILENAGAKLVLTLFENLMQLQKMGLHVAAVDIQLEQASDVVNTSDVTIQPTDLAYIIYTSGSTGQPKGVPIRHMSNLNMALDQIEEFRITTDDRIVQFAPTFFDASIYEWSIAFYAGATLCIPDRNSIKNPERFSDYLEKYKITMATLPPSFFNLLHPHITYWPRVIVQAGSSPNVELTTSANEQSECYNAYGPTENAVCTSLYKVQKGDEVLTQLPIGRPVNGNSVYILDDLHQLVPLGVMGEICVAGMNLTPGYVNDVEKSASAFISNPYNEEEILYKTGDMGRWLPNNVLEFNGRKDRQLKVRGYRIEPGEIEAAMLKITDGIQSVVTVEKGIEGGELLVCYFQSNEESDEVELKSKLSEFLPSYMIPDRLIYVNELPVTRNGKVDFDSLRNNHFTIDHQDSKTSIPSDGIEHQLFNIWKNVLNREDFGIHDKFFEIGGNSLLLIQVHAQIQTIYPHISITDIFSYTTISEMAGYLQNNLNEKETAVSGGSPFEHILEQGEERMVPHQKLPFDIEEEQWKLVQSRISAEGLKVQEVDLALSLFSLALYEELNINDQKILLFDGNDQKFRGVINVEMNAFDSEVELIESIKRKKEDLLNSTGISNEQLSIEKNPREISIGFAHTRIQQEDLGKLKMVDLSMNVVTANNGDLQLKVCWNPLLIKDDLISNIHANLMNVVSNLI